MNKSLIESQYWLHKSLDKMNAEEWEAICDGCGKCCLNSFIDSEDEDDFEPTDSLREGEELIYTNIVCQYLDTQSCYCTEYEKRTQYVPSCVQLTKENVKDIFFMPQSCSYRRLYEGRGLASWHPLLNDGSKQAMHDANISVVNKVIKDNEVDLEDFEDHIADWPKHDSD